MLKPAYTEHAPSYSNRSTHNKKYFWSRFTFTDDFSLSPFRRERRKLNHLFIFVFKLSKTATKSRRLLFWRSFLPCSRSMHTSCKRKMRCKSFSAFCWLSLKIYISLNWLQALMVLSSAISIRRYIIVISHFRRATGTKFQRCPSRTSQTSIRCSLILTLVSLIHTQISCWWIFNVRWQLTNTMSSMITFSVNIAFRRLLQETRNLGKP